MKKITKIEKELKAYLTNQYFHEYLKNYNTFIKEVSKNIDTGLTLYELSKAIDKAILIQTGEKNKQKS